MQRFNLLVFVVLHGLLFFLVYTAFKLIELCLVFVFDRLDSSMIEANIVNHVLGYLKDVLVKGRKGHSHVGCCIKRAVGISVGHGGKIQVFFLFCNAAGGVRNEETLIVNACKDDLGLGAICLGKDRTFQGQ